MFQVRAASLPQRALLQRYQGDGNYADCYVVDLPMPVPHEAFVAAFYTTRVFKLERWLLRVVAHRPSHDREAQQLAAGARDAFAAWTVECRAPDQVLLCDMTGRTRSWLMTAPAPEAGSTRLHFGSAVVPVVDGATGRRRMGLAFHLLRGFHRAYSRVLLATAARALVRSAAARR